MSDTDRCVFCSRVTLQPAAFIGIYPVGPTCARKHAPGELARVGSKGLVRRATGSPQASTARRDNRTRDLFEGAAT